MAYKVKAEANRVSIKSLKRARPDEDTSKDKEVLELERGINEVYASATVMRYELQELRDFLKPLPKDHSNGEDEEAKDRIDAGLSAEVNADVEGKHGKVMVAASMLIKQSQALTQDLIDIKAIISSTITAHAHTTKIDVNQAISKVIMSSQAATRKAINIQASLKEFFR